MTNQYFMKALETFYGTGGYIVKGQDFYVTNKEVGDFYASQGKAIFTDGNSVDDVKIYSRENRENVYFTNQLERNVTSLANPVNLKIAVEGVNPEDLNIEVVRGEQMSQQGASYQTQAEQPQQKQNYQYQNQQNAQPQYEQQNQQPQSQSATSDPQLMEELKHLQEEHHKQMELTRQLEQKIESLQGGSAEQSTDSEQPVFEIRHVGGGWYDLPNGERVQGKANAENRMKEIAGAANSQSTQNFNQPQAQNRFSPNQERVSQANYRPEDGAQLNQAQVDSYRSMQNQGSTNGGNDGQTVGYNQNFGNTFQARNENGQYAEQGRVQNAQTQPRNGEGEFTEATGGFTTGRGGSTGVGGTTGGASTSGNTGGGTTSGTAGTGGGTSGPNSGSGGGASTAGNTNQ